jgi:alpha-ribazole phosphatase
MTELILVRHGETDWNTQGRYQGQSDVPLNEAGRVQADRLAASLQGQAIAAIYSSDLRRARETAEALARSSGAPLHFDPRLREIDQGEWEGMLFDEIQRRYAESFQRRRRDPLRVAPPGGETVGQVRERVLEAVQDIRRRHPGGRVAIISHGLALALVKVHFEGLPIERVWDHIPDNAAPLALRLPDEP